MAAILRSEELMCEPETPYEGGYYETVSKLWVIWWHKLV